MRRGMMVIGCRLKPRCRLASWSAVLTDNRQPATLLVRAVIDELHVDAEIGFAQQLDGGLQRVPILSADAHKIALNGSLYFQLAVLDLLDDLPRLLDGDALLQRHLLFHARPGGLNHLAIAQSLKR